jgi:hypothetical protein
MTKCDWSRDCCVPKTAASTSQDTTFQQLPVPCQTTLSHVLAAWLSARHPKHHLSPEAFLRLISGPAGSGHNNAKGNKSEQEQVHSGAPQWS